LGRTLCLLLDRLRLPVLLSNGRDGSLDISLELIITHGQARSVECLNELDGSRLYASQLLTQVYGTAHHIIYQGRQIISGLSSELFLIAEAKDILDV
jgi:hypothetical protein